MNVSVFRNVTDEQKEEAIKKLVEHSTPHQDFFLMVILSVAMATFGLLIDSVTIIVGSMLIAPILYPIMGFSMGVVMGDGKLMRTASETIFKSFLFAVAVSAVTTLFFAGTDYITGNEILSRTVPALVHFGIALVAGFAVAFAIVKPQLSESLPGVAISVALVPPMSVVGIGIAQLNWLFVSKAFIVFLVNILGIFLAALVVFSLMRFYTKRAVAQKAVAQEEKELKKEAAPPPEK